MHSHTRRNLAQNQPTPLTPASAEELLQLMQGLHDLIARRAYELFEKCGRQHGHDIDDWLQAESEILHSCRHELTELPDSFLIRAELPGGFSLDQIKVSIEPHRVMVSGETLVSGIYSDETKTEARTRVRRILRIHSLSVAVDPLHSKATLDGQQLEINLPKMKRSAGQVKAARHLA